MTPLISSKRTELNEHCTTITNRSACIHLGGSWDALPRTPVAYITMVAKCKWCNLRFAVCAALQTGGFFWGQHLIDEAAAYDHQNGFPPHAPTPVDIWILGLYGLLLLGTASFCIVQLTLYLLQQRRDERSVSASRDA